MSESDGDDVEEEVESSDDVDEGILGFDPKRVGPADLLRGALGSLRSGVSDNLPVVLGTLVATAALALYFDVSLPRPPNWVVVVVLASVLAAPSAWVVGKRLARALYQPDDVLLSMQDPTSGDQRLIRVAPDRFSDMRVVSNNDRERDRSFLHEVRINGRRAYEVDEYDTERNVAVASWQAGTSNSQIRRDRAEIKRIKTSLEREADKALELLANHPNILREQAREVSNRLIKVAEGVEVPSGGELHSRLGDKLDEADPSEDLLDGDPDGDLLDLDDGDDLADVDVDGAPTNGDGPLVGIYQRAKNGESEGSGDE